MEDIQKLSDKIFKEFFKYKKIFNPIITIIPNKEIYIEHLHKLSKEIINKNLTSNIKDIVINYFQYRNKDIEDFCNYALTLYKEKLKKEKKINKTFLDFIEKIIEKRGIGFLIDHIHILPKKYKKQIQKWLEEVENE